MSQTISQKRRLTASLRNTSGMDGASCSVHFSYKGEKNMNKKEYNVGLPIKGNANKVVRGIYKNETGILFNIQFLDGNEPFDYRGFSQIVIDVLLPDGNTVYSDGLKTSDTINPEDGILCFNLPVEYTANVGMHYITIHIYGDDHIIATSRMNYYVDESASDYEQYLAEVDNGMARFTALQQALALVSRVLDAEDGRRIAEELRRTAEEAREDETDGIIATVQQYIERVEFLVGRANNIYEMIESIVESISSTTQVDLSGVAMLTDLNVINGGTFDSVGTGQTIQVKRGEASDLPTLEEGEIGYTTDTGKVYIGTDDGNVILNPDREPIYVISDTAPTDVAKLWIDSAHDNALKVYDDSQTEWISVDVGTAVFV